MISSGTSPAHSLINFLVYSFCNRSAEAKQGSDGRKTGLLEFTLAYYRVFGMVLLYLFYCLYFNRHVADIVLNQHIPGSIV
jgi:hypothetical protein